MLLPVRTAGQPIGPPWSDPDLPIGSKSEWTEPEVNGIENFGFHIFDKNQCAKTKGSNLTFGWYTKYTT